MSGPKPIRRVLKRIVIVLFNLALLLGIVLATLPWWWGAVLRKAMADHGTFVTYETVGYGRWAVSGVSLGGEGWELQVDRIEAPHPLVWALQRNRAEIVTIGSWTLQVSGGNAGASPRTPRPEWSEVVATYDRIAAWIPPVEIAAGELNWAETKSPISVGPADYDGERLRVDAVTWQDWASTLEWRRDTLTLKAEETKHHAAATATLQPENSRVELTGHWREQPVFGQATWTEAGNWRPTAAELRAQDWRLSGGVVGLADYYAAVTGNAELIWTENSFRYQLQGEGLPLPETELPPLRIESQGEGGFSGVRITTLAIEAPGLTATLDAPVEIERHEAGWTQVSHFVLEANLAELPWLRSEGEGTVAGEIVVRPRDGDWPQIEGRLQARDVALRDWRIAEAELEGKVLWPRWNLTRLAVRDDVGSEILVTAEGDARAREIEAGHWEARIDPVSAAPWLPDGISLAGLTGEGELAGAWTNPLGRSEIQLKTLQVPQLRSLDLQVEIQGASADRDWSATIVPRATESRLTLGGRMLDDGLVLQTLQLERAGKSIWTAEDGTEAAVSWRDGGQLAGITLIGAAGELQIGQVTPSAGEVAYAAQRPELDWIADWMAEKPPLFPSLEEALVTFSWAKDVVRFDTHLRGEVTLGDAGKVDVDVAASSDGATVGVEHLTVGRGGTTFLEVYGQLPLRIRRGDTPGVMIDEAGEVDLAAQVSPNPAFWKTLGEWTGVTVSRPEIDLKLRGKWREPQGSGQIRIARVLVNKSIGGIDWPEFTGVAAELTGDGRGLKLDSLTATVAGNPIRMSAALPLTVAEWQRLQESPLAYLREQGSGRVELPESDLAAVARFVPGYLVPTGRVQADMTFERGGNVSGSLQLRGAVSRPLGPLGVLQSIDADLAFDGHQVSVDRIRALMGGQPVELEGTIDWRPGDPVELNLTLKGNNLPLVRRTGVLLRSDLDLALKTDGGGVTTLSGKAVLREGLMLADVRSLLPTVGSDRPTSRPPYFSVEMQPFARWRLNVDVDGERFMRLETPVLSGVASVEAHLDGTLASPRAIGEVTMDSGTVRLPFARLNVESAYARLTAANPYEPEIYLLGSGRRLGYELQMELSGDANDPRLELSSSPALPASDVLLMVMAGVAPKDEVNYTQGRRALQFGVYLGQELVGDVLGLEGGDRLTVTTGERLSRRGRETYRFGYDLNDRWTVTGEYDEFDYYNAGLKWRWFPRPENADTESKPAVDGEKGEDDAQP